MAKKKLTTKKPLVGNRRSHAMNATKHAQRPNYQTYTIDGEKIVTTARKEPRARKCDKKEAA